MARTTSTETPQTAMQRPMRLARALGSEFEQLMNELGLRHRFPPAWWEADSPLGTWAPAIEVQEKGNDFLVRAELPGLTRDQVTVNVTDEVVVVEGEKKKEESSEKEGYYRSERSYGKFRRVIALPDGADPKSAVATFKDGILEVAMHVNEKVSPEMRRLDIG